MINYYGPRIYKILGIETGTSLMIIGISGALSIVYCTIGLWLVDKVGRVKPLMVSAIGMAGALVANAAMSQHLNENNANQLRAMVAMNFVFSLFYTPIGIISWVYPAEIFPVEVRAFGNAITTFSNWTINLVSHMVDIDKNCLLTTSTGICTVLTSSFNEHWLQILLRLFRVQSHCARELLLLLP